MKEFKYVVTDNEGIHARPAGELVKLVKGFESTINRKRRKESRLQKASCTDGTWRKERP